MRARARARAGAPGVRGAPGVVLVLEVAGRARGSGSAPSATEARG